MTPKQDLWCLNYADRQKAAKARRQLLAEACPHGSRLGRCPDMWCRSRVEDLLDGEYAAVLPDLDPS